MNFNRLVLFVVIYISFIEIDGVNCVLLSEKQVKYVREIIEAFTHKQGQLFTCVIHPPNIWRTTPDSSAPDPDDFLLPSVMLWNPLLTHASLFSNGLLCSKCAKECHLLYWNDGGSSYAQPRLIHDTEDIVYLVSAVYSCDQGHKVVGHDQRILNMLPCKDMVPFVLLHKTGFTNKFVTFCTSLCQTGMNFHSLEGAISHQRWDFYESRQQTYLSINSIYHSREGHTNPASRSFPSFSDHAAKHLPSDDVIRQCFLSNFLENELAYLRDIQSVLPGESLSFDHTFKIASNIGSVRADLKWACEYDSAFLVFNGDGKIVTWQFTKGTSFENVRNLLSNIKTRSMIAGQSTIKTVYVDNCCHWRHKIQEVFGVEVTVSLDVFHAVQRITRKLPKKHPFYSACVQELKLVFRSPGDYGLARTKPTPQSPQLEHNIDSFVQRWKGVSYNEQVILTEESIAEIEKLKVHIRKGCLSGISVGGGTNHNEAFHRYINTFFHRSRIGKLLAYAMMMTIISQFNNKEKGRRKAMFRPIRLSLASTDDTVLEQMGIVDCDRSGEDLTWIQEEDDDDMDLVSISNIIRVSLQQFDMYKAMKRQTNTCTQLWKYIPYMQLLPRQLSCEDIEVEAHKERLKNNALAWNFSIVPVLPDGNCFFTSVALALVQDMERSKSVFSHIQMDSNGSIKALSLKLRDIIVKEWLGQHRSEYENFLSNEENCIYEDEVSKFLNDGYYNSALGNTMPLAMSNALGVSFVILTSLCSTPVYYITPRDQTSEIVVLHLAYTSIGAGHYDGLVIKYTSRGPAVSEKIKCRCGVNSKHNKENFIACTHQVGKHSSCRCLAKGQACSELCGCKGCNNPNGSRPISVKASRSREPHKWQLLNTNNRFAADTRRGVWSEMENIVFSNIVQYLYSKSMACESDVLQHMFSSVIKYIHAPYNTITLPQDAILRPKSTLQTANKMKHYLSEKSLFEQVSQPQD